jgi:cytochrome P450
MTLSESLPSLPFPRDSILDIAPQARELLREQPIARVRTLVGDEAWLVTGYGYVKDLFNDPRLGRSHPEPEKAARISNFYLNGGPVGDVRTEQRDQSRMRKLLSPAFSARRMRSLEGRVRELVDTLLEEMARAGPPADLNAAFSFPLPVQVICELLGVPFEDRDMFQRWAYDLDNVYDADLSLGAFTKLSEYTRGLIERKRLEAGEDVISDLIAAEREWDLSSDEIVLLTVSLLFAGHASTAANIDFGVLLLLLNPGQRDALFSHLPAVVEELLRVAPLGSKFGQLRYAHADISIGGVTIRQGDAVLLLSTTSNRDARVFTDPDRVDLTREDNPHLAFGYGPRRCLGANLARLELSLSFESLFRQFPTLRLAEPVENLEFSRTQMVERLTRLPVTW